MIWSGKRKGRHSKIVKKIFKKIFKKILVLERITKFLYIKSKNNVYKFGDGLR